MKNLIYLLLVLVFLTSCISHKRYHDSYYDGEPNYKRFYVVDTISIDDPVVVGFDGGDFVCSRKLLDTVKIDKKFVKRPDVFLLGDYTFGLYFDLEVVEDFYKYSYPDYRNCKPELKTKFPEQKIYLYEYKTPPAFFILGLINVNYYNRKHNFSDCDFYVIKTKDPKISYHKIVYPLCE